MNKRIDKNKDWSDALRDKMRGASTPPSQNLWDNIEKSLDKPNHSLFRYWGRSVAAVAAVLLAIFFIGDFSVEDNVVTPTAIEPIIEISQAIETPVQQESIFCEVKEPEIKPTIEPSTIAAVIEEPEPPQNDTNKPSPTPEPKPKQPSKNTTESYTTPQVDFDTTPKKSHNKKTSLSLLGSGGLFANNSTIITHQSAAYDVLLFPDGMKDVYDYCNVKHYQPFSIGIRVQHSLAPRLSIVSGVNYTQLISDISYDTEFNKQQKIHFVGIPVSLYYQFFKVNNFSLYAGVGGTIEYCVGATVGGVKANEQGFHYSANAVVGAQYNVNDWLGFYFEPEVSYYLTQTNLKSIRNDSPVTFTLRLGVSFTL